MSTHKGKIIFLAILVICYLLFQYVTRNDIVYKYSGTVTEIGACKSPINAEPSCSVTVRTYKGTEIWITEQLVSRNSVIYVSCTIRVKPTDLDYMGCMNNSRGLSVGSDSEIRDMVEEQRRKMRE